MKEISNKIETKIFIDSGHRVPWEKPQEFKEICLKFIKNEQILGRL